MMYKNSILNPSSLPTPHSSLEYLGDIFCLCSMNGRIVSTSSFPLFQIVIYLTVEGLMGWLIEQRNTSTCNSEVFTLEKDGCGR